MQLTQGDVSRLQSTNSEACFELKMPSDERDVLERSEEMLERALQTTANKLRSVESELASKQKSERLAALESAADEEKRLSITKKALMEESRAKLASMQAEMAGSRARLEKEKENALEEAAHAFRTEIAQLEAVPATTITALEAEKTSVAEEAAEASVAVRSKHECGRDKIHAGRGSR